MTAPELEHLSAAEREALVALAGDAGRLIATTGAAHRALAIETHAAASRCARDFAERLNAARADVARLKERFRTVHDAERELVDAVLAEADKDHTRRTCIVCDDVEASATRRRLVLAANKNANAVAGAMFDMRRDALLAKEPKP